MDRDVAQVYEQIFDEDFQEVIGYRLVGQGETQDLIDMIREANVPPPSETVIESE